MKCVLSLKALKRNTFLDVCDEHPESIEMLRKLAGDGIDITNIDAIRTMVKENDVKVIVNYAAWTNVACAEDLEKYNWVKLLKC